MMNNEAIIKITKLILDRANIKNLPVPIYEITKKYSEIIEKDIPFDFDGLSIKNKYEKHKIIINSSNSNNRKLFTLAHELGHIMIPWHCGIIVDKINDDNFDYIYKEFESEANLFASELLLPSFIIEDILKSYLNNGKHIGEICNIISEKANTSLITTTLKLYKLLDISSLCIITNNKNIIEYSTKSQKSHFTFISKNKILDMDLFKENYSIYKISKNSNNFYYFTQLVDIEYKENGENDWKNILNEILENVSDKKKQEQKINGIIGAFHGKSGKSIKIHKDYFIALKEYFLYRNELKVIVNHEKFDSYLQCKINTLIKK